MKQKKFTKIKKHRLEYFIINVFVFTGIGLLSFVVFNVSLFNQFTQAFKDFTLTDVYYSKILHQNKIYNGPLVIINIENKSRGEIAFLLQKIEEAKPKVVGLDVIFPDKKDAAGDSLLKEVFAKNTNLVLPYVASFNMATAEVKNNEYFQVYPTSFVNISGEQKEFTTIRYYYPFYNNVPAFTTAIMQMFDADKAKAVVQKGQQKTEIRYFGDLQNFAFQTFDEVMNPAFNLNSLQNKIVLIGYAGTFLQSKSQLDEDRVFTPLNAQLSGRSYPDMYGVVVHANILRMALDKDFIYTLPGWLNWCLAFLLTWLLLPIFVKWYVNKAVWFHLFTMFLQLIISLLFVFFTIIMYAYFNIKIESSAVLVAVLLVGDFLLFYDHLIKFLKHKLALNLKSKFLEGAH